MKRSEAEMLMTYDANKKDTLLAYLLWFFLGSFGVHRMYLGHMFSGLFMAALHLVSWALTIIFIGWIGLAILGILWVLDAFLIPGMVERHNYRLAQMIGR